MLGWDEIMCCRLHPTFFIQIFGKNNTMTFKMFSNRFMAPSNFRFEVNNQSLTTNLKTRQLDNQTPRQQTTIKIDNKKNKQLDN